MKYEQFLKLLMNHKKFMEDTSKLNGLGFDFYEGKFKLVDIVDTIFKTTIESHYNKDGVEWIYWFIHESDYGQKDFSTIPTFKTDKDGKHVKLDDDENLTWGATDVDGNPICYSYETLYEYIERYKLKNK
jgi:hypothetical protein